MSALSLLGMNCSFELLHRKICLKILNINRKTSMKDVQSTKTGSFIIYDPYTIPIYDHIYVV